MYCCVHRLALTQLHLLCLGKKVILQALCQLSIQFTLDLTCGKKKKQKKKKTAALTIVAKHAIYSIADLL